MSIYHSGYQCTGLEKQEEVLSYNGRKIITGEGFNWGYGGSGPQYLAEAIASHCTNNNYTEEEWKVFFNKEINQGKHKGKDLFISEHTVSSYFRNSHKLSKFQIIEQYVNDYAKYRKEILDNPLDFAYLVKNHLNKKLYEPTEYVIFDYLNEYFKNDYSSSIHKKENISNEREKVLSAMKVMSKHFDITSHDLF